MLKVFIGYDRRFAGAYHTLAHSIMKHASEPVAIIPLKVELLRAAGYTRSTEGHTTEFKFSRFMVPALCNYQGPALFLDVDMLFLDDVAKLFAEFDTGKAVQVVKHDYTPKRVDKSKQYNRVNWSSVILFNCDQCQALTPSIVSNADYMFLHQFKWTTDELIGDLHWRWNYLVEEYETVPLDQGPKEDRPANLHFTKMDRQPWLNVAKGAPYYDVWQKAHKEMQFCKDTFP